MRKEEFTRLFLVALAIPYLLLILLAGVFIYRDLTTVGELKNLEKITVPLEDLSALIIHLNVEKVYRVFQTINPNLYTDLIASERKKLLQKVETLKEDLKRDRSWVKYCECEEVLNFEEVLKELQNLNVYNIKNYLEGFDKIINEYCYYYIQLSSGLKLKKLSLEFKSLYTLHKFNTVVSDLTTEMIYYLSYRNRNFLYSSYYYNGEIRAYADIFYALSDRNSLRKKFKNGIYNSEFLKKLLEGNYLSVNELLTDFRTYTEAFENFHKEQMDFLKHLLRKEIDRYRFEIWNVITLTVLGLLSLLVVSFLIYQYGHSRYSRMVLTLERKAFKDPLTGLYNRRFFNHYIANMLRNRLFSDREEEPLSFILIDLDNFKQINDTYGHQFGDKVLKHVAKIIRHNIRSEDIAVRWGGEEFAIFVKAPLDAAVRLAERIRKAIENSSINGIKLTASFGVGEITGENPKEAFKKIDEALYRAKRLGKNRVEIAY